MHARSLARLTTVQVACHLQQVLAFNLLNKYFPGATPSGFTQQRQDAGDMFEEVYQRIAAGDNECEVG